MAIRGWREIKYILWDFDLTLGKTQEVFNECHGIAYLYLANALGLDPERIKEQHWEIWGKAFKVHNVDPHALIAASVLGFREIHPGVSVAVLNNYTDLLYQTYFKPIDLFEDVKPVLEELEAKGIEMGVVTHAEEEWSIRKNGWTGVGRYLKKKKFFSADVRLPKTTEVWINGAVWHEFERENTLVCGDNVEADANQAVDYFYVACWLNRKQKSRSLIGEGVKRPGVVEVHDLYTVRDLVILNNEAGV